MLHKYLKYKNKYLSGGSIPSHDKSFTVDIINMIGDLLYNISFEDYISIKEVRELINDGNISYKLLLNNDELKDDYELNNDTILTLIKMTTLFNILDYKLINNEVIIKNSNTSDFHCVLTFKFDPRINLYIKSKDNLSNIYFNNIEEIKFINTIDRYRKTFMLILKPTQIDPFDWDYKLMDEKTLRFFNTEMNDYKMVKYKDENYYYVQLQLNNAEMSHQYVILFNMPYIDNTNKENIQKGHRLYADKEKLECDTRIYDNDFIKFFNKFYVEYVN